MVSYALSSALSGRFRQHAGSRPRARRFACDRNRSDRTKDPRSSDRRTNPVVVSSISRYSAFFRSLAIDARGSSRSESQCRGLLSTVVQSLLCIERVWSDTVRPPGLTVTHAARRVAGAGTAVKRGRPHRRSDRTCSPPGPSGVGVGETPSQRFGWKVVTGPSVVAVGRGFGTHEDVVGVRGFVSHG